MSQIGDHRVRALPDKSMPVVAPPVIGALTGVRALAAAWVVLFHLHEKILVLVPPAWAVQFIMAYGYLGVDVFFVLSGFIISHNYAERLASRVRGANRSFYVARLARIYPVHLVMFLGVAGLMGLAALTGRVFNPLDVSPLSFITNSLMLQGLPGTVAWNIPSWSITCEAAAYLLFPLLASALLRTRPLPAMFLCAGLLVGLVTIGAMLASLPEATFVALFNWVRIATEFSVGCLAWCAWRHGVRAHWRWDVVAAGSLVLVASILYLHPVGVLPFLTMPLLVLFLVSVPNCVSIVRLLLTSRVAEWGGRISYSWYLTHYPTALLLFALLDPVALAATAPLWQRALVVAIYFLGTVVIGAAVYHLVEEPARRWVRTRADVQPETPRKARTTDDRDPGGAVALND